MDDWDGFDEGYEDKTAKTVAMIVAAIVVVAAVVAIVIIIDRLGLEFDVNTDRVAPQYQTCSEAYAAGRSNIPSSDPDYLPKLDRDQNGVACERR
ncbi:MULTISPECIES: excalibur calcium-binding domain-containing protein [Mycobacterium ulcerans group]|uniref:Excalibur calcium-binding domain-containing protein n=2 Tax=Mycobacterium ulcerans group TaxID=2993898 RepID=A0A9N7QRG7_9MYCO|nr:MULTISPECIES: excalibur calcium-binding domain-containing protein [Mycobacterium ulcerans group]UZK92687.1 excalibur calcium-binding domain-containing protein [Mycobacterium ulcerans]ACA50938.1 hypothetical protein MUDP_017 [Mycobacterium marinum DL240490]MBC9862660.1 hypothetical protein [Mycobacterium pseudoshottsii]BDN85435.1 hypothetical protein NJB1907Z4_P0870 [Mycobacterium pseudoshottsii]GAQ32774.1 hypothetical protein MPS_1154 [Mycobacterium pseudoshottsii JCM 15466]